MFFFFNQIYIFSPLSPISWFPAFSLIQLRECVCVSVYEGHQTTRLSLDLLQKAKLNSGLPPDLNLFLHEVLFGSFVSILNLVATFFHFFSLPCFLSMYQFYSPKLTPLQSPSFHTFSEWKVPWICSFYWIFK